MISLHAFIGMESMLSMQYFSESANFFRFNRIQNIHESPVRSSDGRLKVKVARVADKSFFRMTNLISAEQLRVHDSTSLRNCCLRKDLFIRRLELSILRGPVIVLACALLSLEPKLKLSLMLSPYQQWKQNLRGTVRDGNFFVKKCWWKFGHCLLVVGLCLFLQIPTGNCLAPTGSQALDCFDAANYYKGTEGLKGRALRLKLHDIVDGHVALSYAQVWDALKILDAADKISLGISSKVVEIYSLRKVSNNLAGKLNGWNREHLWPHSYGLHPGHPEFTDLHNLRPADVNVNSSRGNKYFGDCIQRHSSDCRVPANQEAASDTAADKESWRPPSQVRGDIARAMMYMAVRYGSDELGGIPLQLSNAPSTEKAEMGLLSVLMQWNAEDPPSPSEKLRNARVCSLYQHNRNPFVDHPEFSHLIWGP